MERKNTVLLTVIAVATLLVAVVGATFAYFTATATSEGTDVGKVETTTATVGGVKLNATSIAQVGKMDYPGGVLITGTKVEVTKQNMSDQNNYEVSYSIGLTGINKTTEDMKWYLLRTSSDGSDQDISNHTKCELKTDSSTQDIKYYYENCDVTGSSGIISSEFSDYDLVAYGTLSGNTDGSALSPTEGATSFDSAFGTEKEPIGLADQKLTTNGTTVYTYYLIVEFPNNKGASQNGSSNENFNKQISVSFDSIDSISTKVLTE